ACLLSPQHFLLFTLHRRGYSLRGLRPWLTRREKNFREAYAESQILTQLIFLRLGGIPESVKSVCGLSELTNSELGFCLGKHLVQTVQRIVVERLVQSFELFLSLGRQSLLQHHRLGQGRNSSFHVFVLPFRKTDEEVRFILLGQGFGGLDR